MSINGKNHTNGNGKSARRKTSEEVTGFTVAEIAGAITTVGAMYAVQMLPKSIMDPATNVVGKVLEPIQERLIEPTFGMVCKLDECKPDKKKPVSERAKNTARILLLAVPSIIAAWYTKLGMRRWFNKTYGIVDSHAGGSIFNIRKWSPEEKMLILADEGTHLAAMALANSSVGAPVTDNVITNMKDVFKNLFGMKEDDAHEMSTMIAIHEIPNLIGMGASAAVIAGRHYRDWPSGWVGRILGRKDQAASFAEKISGEAANLTHRSVAH